MMIGILKPGIFYATCRSLNSSARCLSTNRIRSTKQDPGIGNRRKLVHLHDQVEDVDDFEDVESDFMEVHKSHKQHFRDLELMREREKYLIVRQKYFQHKYSNFLTWHDKEQIRYLHRTNSEEWTIEKLSEGFPALPETIQKIVKSNWSKTKQHKIANHDASVQKSWRQFKKGQIPDLPQDLVEHLNKFTSRELNLKPFVAPECEKAIVETKREIGTDFSDIITSYKKSVVESATQQIAADNLQNSSPKLSKKTSLVTLAQLQANLQRKGDTGKSLDENDQLIVNMVKSRSNNIQNVKHNLEDLVTNKYEASGSMQHIKTEKDISFLNNYPEQITIPKEIAKKGCVYKLNDCYYDDDGEFLYRVPGMT